MTRIKKVLQTRAERFRRKHAKPEEKKYFVQSVSYDDETNLTEQCIGPQMDPDGMEPKVESSGSVYSLEAKGTRATTAETFSSGEENTSYSDDNNYSEHDPSQFESGGEFADLVQEAAKKRNNLSSGAEVIDLMRESANRERVGVNRSNYESYEDADEDNLVTENGFSQPETIEFVDSEDGKVFEIPQRDVRGHGGLLQNVRSLDETYNNDDCSKTLNTNHENNQARYMSRTNNDDIDHSNSSDRFRQLQVNIEDEPNEECDDGDVAFEVDEYVEDPPTNQGASELYDCDDGEMYFPDDTQEYGHGVQPYGLDEDGNFFDHVRVQSRNLHGQQHLEMVDQQTESKNWQSATQQIHLEQSGNAHLYTANDGPASPQLEDPYQSDGNSSWEEGSFATGASRAVSRVDIAGEDYDNADEDEEDEEGNSYERTVDGSDYDSDDNTYADYHGDRPFVRILKKFRDMNVDDELSYDESEEDEDEEDYEDRKRRSRRNKQKRRSKSKPVTVFERLGELGMDILNETIEHAERQDRVSRGQDNSDQGGTFINTFADLFSCGAPAAF
eukprot:jgi/Psemu1/284103/fgenesh1_pg.42_\